MAKQISDASIYDREKRSSDNVSLTTRRKFESEWTNWEHYLTLANDK